MCDFLYGFAISIDEMHFSFLSIPTKFLLPCADTNSTIWSYIQTTAVAVEVRVTPVLTRIYGKMVQFVSAHGTSYTSHLPIDQIIIICMIKSLF